MTAVKDSPGRTYGGQTGGERTRARREALLDAAFGLVADLGWRDLSIEAVCRRAGLNKRYFYESFSGLDDLTAALTAQLADDAIAVTIAGLEPPAPRDAAISRAITALVEHLTDDPRRLRVLFGAVPAADAAAGHRAAAIRRVINSAAEHGRSIYALEEDDPLLDATAAMVIGGTSQALLDWLDGRVECSRQELTDHVVALWQAIGATTTARVRARAR